MVYHDRADCHYGGDYPDDLPPENGATHIGMYLGWVIKRGMVGDIHIEDSREVVDAVRGGALSGRDFLFEHCDGKFCDQDLNDEANRFTAAYYYEQYFEDYFDCLDSDDAESGYHIENSPENQAQVEAFLDRRFAAWRQEQCVRPAPPTSPKSTRRRAAREKPWWKFW